MDRRPLGAASGRASLMDRFLAWRLPLIGGKVANTQVQILMGVMAVCAIVVLGVLFYDARLSANGTLQTEIVGETLMHTQRLAKAAPYAIQGNATAFAELKDSRDHIDANLEALVKGDSQRGLSASSAGAQLKLSTLSERWTGTRAAASTIINEEKALVAFSEIVRRINDATPRLLQLTEEISALKLQSAASSREIAASGQLVMLTQRLGKSANSLVSGETANAEVALTLSRDINLFRDLTQALLSGSDTLRIAATTDNETRVRLQELAKFYGEF